ncbi:MAG: CBS domain-containing protein [Bacteroidota bacterium]
MISQIAIEEVMITNPVCVALKDLMTVVDQLFKKNTFHHLPVVDEEGVLVGIISKVEYFSLKDSFSLLRPNKSRDVNERLLSSLLVKDVMKKSPIVLNADDTLIDAALIFDENKFHALPSVEEDDRLIGIITPHDLIRKAYL